MFENEIFSTILERILSRVGTEYDKREGSIIYDAVAPVSMELWQAYQTLDWTLLQTFADTAEREFLILRAKEYGVYPKEAGYAYLLAECGGVDVPIGTRFSLVDSELNYIVTERLPERDRDDLQGYMVKCETIGAVGNKYLGDLLPINQLTNLRSARLAEVLIPGEDAEETEHFRRRYFDEFSGRAFGGNRKDYINRVLALEGVGAVKVYPVWNYTLSPASLIPGVGVANGLTQTQSGETDHTHNYIGGIFRVNLALKEGENVVLCGAY
jgi:uncharacterized phage protein gp47/JayE